jgi:hypothetical protein
MNMKRARTEIDVAVYGIPLRSLLFIGYSADEQNRFRLGAPMLTR